MDALLRDIRFGVRILLRSPGIAVAVVLALAFGIGANSAMFSVVDALLLHPVHYPDPSSLVFVWDRDAQGTKEGASAANFLDWRARAKSFSGLSAWVPTMFVVSAGDRPRQITGARVTSDFFHTLGVKPMLGRTFLPEEDGLGSAPAASRVAVIGYSFWRDNLGADPNVLRRTIQLSSIPYAIVGVMPPDFQFWWRQDNLWVPISVNREDRDYPYLVTIARLNSPRERASAEMTVLARVLEAAYPKSNQGHTIQVEDFQEALISHTLRTRVLLLFAAMGLVLLIACTNVASLLLVRSAGRNREIALRLALGGTPARLARQLLTESLLLSLTGGALGLALAGALIGAAPSIVPANAIPAGAVIELNGLVIGFTFAVAVLTGVLFGLAPAMAAARSQLVEALKDSSRGSTAGPGRQRFRQAMVAAEVAAALILLASAGLMIESLRHLSQVNPGCDPRHVLTAHLYLPVNRYDSSQALRLHRLALQRITALPGVVSATVTSNLPLINIWMTVPFDLESAPPRDAGERPGVGYITASPGYFSTLGIPIKRGRAFTEADNETAPPVVILNEEFASRCFPNQNPIGRTILFNRPTLGKNGFGGTIRAEIVGVAGNVRQSDLSAGPEPLIYAPHAQNVWLPGVSFAIRTRAETSGLAAAIRREMMAIDKDLPVEQVGTLDRMLADQLAEPRFQTQLMGSFALLALLLAVVGIYSVNAYAVTQRRHEIGVRLALGASQGAVLRQIIGQGMRPAAIGIGAGIVGAIAVASLLKSVLVGVSATDPVTLVGVAALLAAVAAVACYIPARKAARIDPAEALRPE